MHVTPYLHFSGTCDEAMQFYAQVFRTDPPQIFRYKDMPPEDQAQMPGVPADAVMNASITHPGGMIMADDVVFGEPQKMSGSSIHLGLPSVAEAHRVFDALAQGGEVGMPMQKTFWTPAFGTVADKYGTRWMVSVAEGVTA